MGGHGGLNILPQKRWNVYNFDNREKVRKDEEAAVREEQIKQAQSRRRDFELRLQKLRHTNSNPNPSSSIDLSSNHINLFADDDGDSSKSKKRKRDEKEKEKEKVVMTADDMKYKLGYGLAGKGVKTPWYLKRSEVFKEKEDEKEADFYMEKKSVEKRKKSIEELREERIIREKKEKGRAKNLVRDLRRKEREESGHSSRSKRNSVDAAKRL